MTMVHASRLREFLQEHGLGNIYTLLEPEGVSVTDMHKSVEQGGDTFYDWMRSLKVPYKDIDTLERALRKKEGGVSMKAIEETGDARALLAAMAAAGQSAKPALAAPAFNGDILSAALGKAMSIDADAIAAARAEEAAAAAAAEKKRPARPKRPEPSYYDPIPVTFADTPFVPSATFVGRQPGYVFKAGNDGVGYYRDAPNSAGGEWKAYAQPADWESGLP